jgi:hypothetical protein
LRGLAGGNDVEPLVGRKDMRVERAKQQRTRVAGGERARENVVKVLTKGQ